MLELNFENYKIRLSNESDYETGSTDNISNFKKRFSDEEVGHCGTKHGIKIYRNEKLFADALICANGGATGIHKNSAVIAGSEILICCANKIFSLSLPDLSLNWTKKVDEATCFRIFKNEHGIFVHGELEASKIDAQGNIIWSIGFADILVTSDGTDCFAFCKDFIEITDWNYRKYKVDFDGNMI